MDFSELKKAELLAAADVFGVEVAPTATKPLIIAALNEDGVTTEMYQEAFKSAEDEEAPVVTVTKPAPEQPKGSTVLLKMTRANGTYEIRGYRFTRENPYLPVDEDSANYILENITGFKIASPRDAQEFYS